MTDTEYRRLERFFSEKFASLERRMEALEREVHASAEFRSNITFLWKVILGLAALAIAGSSIAVLVLK